MPEKESKGGISLQMTDAGQWREWHVTAILKCVAIRVIYLVYAMIMSLVLLRLYKLNVDSFNEESFQDPFWTLMMIYHRAMVAYWDTRTGAVTSTMIWAKFLGVILLLPPMLMLYEMLYTIIICGGIERRRFCVSVAIFLLSFITTQWAIEFYLVICRAMDRASKVPYLTTQIISGITGYGAQEICPEGHPIKFQIKFFGNATVIITTPLLATVSQQLLVFTVVIGKWGQPNLANINRADVATLMMGLIGLGADTVDIMVYLRAEQIANLNDFMEHVATYVLVMSVFTSMLLLYPILLGTSDDGDSESFELFVLMATVMFQDLPCLALRFTLLQNYRLNKASLYFYFMKNTLLFILDVYRSIYLSLGK